MDSSKTALPRWDSQPLFPGLDSPDFAQAMQTFLACVDELDALCDRFDVRAPQGDATPNACSVAAAFEALLGCYEGVLSTRQRLVGYLECLLGADSANEPAQATASALSQHLVRLSVLETRLVAWLGSLDVDSLTTHSRVARVHAYLLRRTRVQLAHLMPPAEEALAAELGATGAAAWANLYQTLSAQLHVSFERNGVAQELPMSTATNLGFEADREVRRAAHAARNAVWQAHALPLAAALNAIKGELIGLSRRRGWASALDAAVFDNNIDRPTLDAMLDAVDEALPHFRRYLCAKARALDVPVLAGYDLFAPIGAPGPSWTFDAAATFIRDQFGAFSPNLQELAERAFREGWIDAEPRLGKAGGAFCLHVGHGESRVLVNYTPTFKSVSTLAHELGHAYHHHLLGTRATPLQQTTPLTLAETAGTFCELLVQRAALDRADPNDCLTMLDAWLHTACLLVVDATTSLLIEKELCARREARELSAEELTELALRVQRNMYGDTVDEGTLFPYLWAEVPQFYVGSFYTFPYTFGFLFGVGLYALYRTDPEGFQARYDEFLASTGQLTAEDLAGRLGLDIRSPDFWRSSLVQIRQDIDRFEALVGHAPMAGAGVMAGY
jgi:pepF/M3 family oligoendopeptidase